MPFPVDLVLVTVTGTILRPDDIPAAGTVKFAMPYPLRDTAGHVIVGNTPPSIATLVGGTFSVQLPATDQSQISPLNWAYTITISTDATYSVFQAMLPSSPSTTTLDELVPVVIPPVAEVYVPLTSVGVANGVASLDGTGHVPAAQLPSGGSVPDATTSSKGIVQLTGDLAGTADAPTVPGLAVNTAAITAETARAEAAESTLTTAIAAKYTRPGSGIPASDLASAVQTELTAASTAYQKPVGGIPSSDMSTAVQADLALAATALQTAPVTSVAGHTGAVTLGETDITGLTTDLGTLTTGVSANATAITAETTRAEGAEATLTTSVAAKYTKPDTGIPSSDMASAVQTSLGLANTSVQSVTAADGTVTVAGTATAPTVAVNAIPESKVTGLTTDLAGKVPATRQVLTGTGLTGGGNLSADLTLSATAATTSTEGIVQLAGDLAGTAAAPQVTSTHLASPLPITQGGTGSATLPTAAALGAVPAVWQPVAGRTTTNPNPGTGSSGLIQSACRVARTVHRITTPGLSSIRLEYGNWYTQQTVPGEVAGPNAVSYRAAIEYPAGIWRQVSGSTAWDSGTTYYANDQVTYSGATYVALATTTAGHAPSSYIGTEWAVVTRYLVTWTGQDSNRRITCAGGTSVQSLPVALGQPTATGALIAVSTEATTASTSSYIPPGDLAYTSSPGWDFALDYATPLTVGAPTDPVDSGVTTQTTLGNGTPVPMPLAITGAPADTSSTLLLGDSIMLGVGDSYTDSYEPGWAVRALGGAASWWRSAKTGDQAAFFLSADTIRLGIAARTTAAIVDYGTNDIRSGNGLSTIQTNLVAVWTALAQRGLAVWQTTITPQTTSTDSWATVGGQTAAPGFGPGSVWANLNAWLRGGAAWYIGGVSLSAGQPGHPLTGGVLDVAAAVTDAGTGWAWVPTWTSDGIHPTAAGHAAMATAAATFIDARSATLLRYARYAGATRAFTSGTLTPSASANTNGTAITCNPGTGQQGFVLFSMVRAVFSGTFGSETVTCTFTATFSDNTTASATVTATSASTQVLSSGGLLGLAKDGLYVKSVAAALQSTIASSTVTATYSLVAAQC